MTNDCPRKVGQVYLFRYQNVTACVHALAELLVIPDSARRYHWLPEVQVKIRSSAKPASTTLFALRLTPEPQRKQQRGTQLSSRPAPTQQ